VADLRRKFLVFSGVFSEIPYSPEQGILKCEQGIILLEQRISLNNREVAEFGNSQAAYTVEVLKPRLIAVDCGAPPSS
jgi:hypothetical protein